MSLQNKIKLADLKEKADTFYKARLAKRQEVLEKAINDIKDEFTSYLSRNGFECKDNSHSNSVEALYKDSIFVSLKYESPDQRFFGCDTVFEFSSKRDSSLRSEKKINAVLLLRTEELPNFSYMGSSEGKEIKEIEFYESTLLPTLESIGVSDINGDYTLGIRETDKRGITPKSVEKIIDTLMA